DASAKGSISAVPPSVLPQASVSPVTTGTQRRIWASSPYRSGSGAFYGCSQYPKCQNTLKASDIERSSRTSWTPPAHANNSCYWRGSIALRLYKSGQ
ncbi:hypothetical protein HER39_19840, partial [Arthrobacter deserti]|nr:hypothetical protein [Arthrobacter deserti]